VQTDQKRWTSFILPVAFIAGMVLLLTLDVGDTQPVEPGPVRGLVREILGYMTVVTEIIAGVVIGIGVLRAFFAYLSHYVHPNRQEVTFITDTRLALGRTLILGLELAVASDILRTIVAPTRADIISLGAIVMLRSLLNFVLEWEIDRDEKRRAESE
jgi:uncharacterized membrane protein